MLVGGFVAVYMKKIIIRKPTQKRVLLYVPDGCGKDILLVKHLSGDGLMDGLWRENCRCIIVTPSILLKFVAFGGCKIQKSHKRRYSACRFERRTLVV